MSHKCNPANSRIAQTQPCSYLGRSGAGQPVCLCPVKEASGDRVGEEEIEVSRTKVQTLTNKPSNPKQARFGIEACLVAAVFKDISSLGGIVLYRRLCRQRSGNVGSGGGVYVTDTHLLRAALLVSS